MNSIKHINNDNNLIAEHREKAKQKDIDMKRILQQKEIRYQMEYNDVINKQQTISANKSNQSDDMMILFNKIKTKIPLNISGNIEDHVIEKPLIEKPLIENPLIENPLIEKLLIEKPLIENRLINGSDKHKKCNKSLITDILDLIRNINISDFIDPINNILDSDINKIFFIKNVLFEQDIEQLMFTVKTEIAELKNTISNSLAETITSTIHRNILCHLDFMECKTSEKIDNMIKKITDVKIENYNQVTTYNYVETGSIKYRKNMFLYKSIPTNKININLGQDNLPVKNIDMYRINNPIIKRGINKLNDVISFSYDRSHV